MSSGHDSRDPRLRPPDPAGTRPKHDPQSLLPEDTEPLLSEAEIVEADVVEEDDGDTAEDGSLLPARRPAGAPAHIDPLATTRWTPRFQFLLGILVAIGFAAIVAVVYLAVRPAPPKQASQRWSSWAPSSDDDDRGAEQIAQHVETHYRLGGRQLVQVSGGPLEVEGVPLDIAVRDAPDTGGDIKYFHDGGLMYRMCGLGPNCSIASGKASPERHLLLRREGLEMALYSFHYLGVKSVVVLLPPPKGQSPTQALFLRARDVTPQLDHPLSASLTARTPSASNIKVSPDAALVSAITTPKVFTFSLTQANTEGRGILVLDPFDDSQPSSSSSSSSPSPSSPGG